jgi:hypothetical protein
MKINIHTQALRAIIGLALISAPVTAQAQTPTPAPAASAPADAATKPAKTPYEGSITAIDSTSVTVTTATGSLTLALTGKTKMAVDQVHAHVTDFAVGDKVKGHYSTEAGGALSASSLYKKTQKTAAAPAAQ